MTDPCDLHSSAIVVDAVCPLLRDRRYLDRYIDGGVSVAVRTVASTESASQALRAIAGWKRAIAADRRLVCGAPRPAARNG